jgi:RNA polymerase sigma-70 factor, ECF subfamily
MADAADAEREISWVLRAQSGSQEALNELFKVLQDPLFRYVRSLVREPSHAEDILQEAFVRIYRKLNWLREPRALRPWAYQIATRETFRYLRRQERWSNKQLENEDLSGIVDSSNSDFPAELISQLPQLIENLSPASRAVIVLYYLHELSLSETAAVLEIPIGTVKSRLAYGLRTLRRAIDESAERQGERNGRNG